MSNILGVTATPFKFPIKALPLNDNYDQLIVGRVDCWFWLVNNFLGQKLIPILFSVKPAWFWKWGISGDFHREFRPERLYSNYVMQDRFAGGLRREVVRKKRPWSLNSGNYHVAQGFSNFFTRAGLSDSTLRQYISAKAKRPPKR